MNVAGASAGQSPAAAQQQASQSAGQGQSTSAAATAQKVADIVSQVSTVVGQAQQAQASLQAQWGQSAQTEYATGQSALVCTGWATPAVDPRLDDFQKALETIARYYDSFDTAAGIGSLDGVVGTQDLEAMVQSDMPKALRDAARFLLQNPDLYDRVDRGLGWLFNDGKFLKGDVMQVLSELRRTQAARAAAGQGGGAAGSSGQAAPADAPRPGRVDTEVQPGRTQGGAGPASAQGPLGSAAAGPPPSAQDAKEEAAAQSELRKVLDDASLDFDQKMKLAMNAMVDGTELEMEACMRELDQAELEAASADDPKKRAAAGALSRRLLQRLQELMNRRQQLFTLLSNMQATFHQMAMTAIHNLKG